MKKEIKFIALFLIVSVTPLLLFELAGVPKFIKKTKSQIIHSEQDLLRSFAGSIKNYLSPYKLDILFLSKSSDLHDFALAKIFGEEKDISIANMNLMNTFINLLLNRPLYFQLSHYIEQ